MSSKKRAAGRVVVVGSSNTDLVVHCATLPSPGETVLGKDMLTFAGGKGANQAVAAARAGAKVHFIGAFGDDAFGRARRADLECEGIDCSGCVTKKGVPSGVALIGIGCGTDNTKAENLIIVAPGANARLTPEDVKRGMPKFESPWDVLLCSLEVPLNSVAAAMKIAFAANSQVILNPAPLPPSGLPPALLNHAHFITPNDTEFEQIAGAKIGTPAAIKSMTRIARSISHSKPYPLFFVTRGARGVDMYDARLGSYGEHFAKAPKVKPVDTVGAGDCFNGCLAAALTHHPSNVIMVDEAVQFAVAAASLKVTRQGAQAGMPRHNEILKMLRKM